MLKRLVHIWLHLPFFIQVIWLLCASGTALNAMLVVQDLVGDPLLWRVHMGFFLLYTAQLVLILLQEKYIFILTLLQGIFALCTSADFIFIPLLQALGTAYYWACNPSIEAVKQYEYICESAAVTLQLASAYYMWAYFSYKKRTV